jgi:hypothetical protein
MKVESTWTVYRTRFVVRARQLTEPLVFTDALGRDHSGQPGDYVVESSEGFRCIRPRVQFENIYVPLQASANGTSHARGLSQAVAPGVLAPQNPPDRQPAPAWSG